MEQSITYAARSVVKINKQSVHLSNLHSIHNYALESHWFLGNYLFLYNSRIENNSFYIS